MRVPRPPLPPPRQLGEPLDALLVAVCAGLAVVAVAAGLLTLARVLA